MAHIAWFSCGAASAVAAKLAIKQYPHVRVIYQDTGSEHPDNKRFLVDCEQWFGQKVEVTKSKQYKDIWDVFEQTRYLVGTAGARCTGELKRKVAEDIIWSAPVQPYEILGYTVEEKNRVARFMSINNERKIVPILIEHGLTKGDCLAIIASAGIEVPAMYKLGYQNNNCIGCVKGQAGYWNKIRRDFPDVFARMAKVERELDVAINKRYQKRDPYGNKYPGRGVRQRVFLDEMPETMGADQKPVPMDCGIICTDTVELIN